MNKKITFNNFHHQTKALFLPYPTPKDEPDFISQSGSCYWDIIDGVIRYSDHWVGQGGCFEQRTCKWSFSEHLLTNEWATGFCSYSDFSIRGYVINYAIATEKDVVMAQLLSDGTLIRAKEWISMFGTRQPSWITLCEPNSFHLDVGLLKRINEQNINERFVSASHIAIQEILDNGRYPLSRSLE